MQLTNKVLVIEDETSIAEVILDLLRLNNIDGYWAVCGKEALSKIESMKFDLVLCDINLPDINGYEILKAVRNIPFANRIPFVFLTAYSSEDDKRYGMNLGADDYITKPFRANVLIDAIHARIRQGREENIRLNREISKKWLQLTSGNFYHEFISPLNGILTAGTILETLIPEQVQTDASLLLRSIFFSGHRLLRNVRKLLAYTELQSSPETVAKYARIGTVDMLVATQNTLDHYYKEDLMNLRFYCHAVNHKIQNACPEYVELVLSELIENMLLYHVGHDAPIIKIEISDGCLLVHLTNSIASPTFIDRQHLNPFSFRDDRTSRQGLGVGLYLVENYMKHLGAQFLLDETTSTITATIAFNL